MFPTCSNRLLAGRNALSATDLTIVSSGSRTSPAASGNNIIRWGGWPPPPTVGAPLRAARHAPAGRSGLPGPRAMVCSPRFGGGDRHKQPPHCQLLRGAADPSAALAAALAAARDRRLARAAATSSARTRTSRRATSRSRSRRPSSRPSSGSPRPPTCSSRSRTPATRRCPNLAVTIYTGDEKARRLVLGAASDQPGLANPNRPGLDPRERASRSARARRGHRRAGLRPAGRRRGGADQHLRVRPARVRARARTIVWRVTPVVGRHLHGPLRARRRARRQGARPSTEDGSPVEGRVRGHDQRQAPAAPASTTTATSRSKPSRARGPDSLPSGRCGHGGRSLRDWRQRRCSPAAADDDVTTVADQPASTTSTTATAEPGAGSGAVGDGEGGVALDRDRRLRPAGLRHPAAERRPRPPLRGRAVRADPAGPDRRRRAERLPRPRRPGHLRRRAGPALDRLRPRLRRLGLLLRRLHRLRRATRGSVEYRRSAGDPAIADPEQRRGAAADRRLRPEPQRRPAPVRPRRHASTSAWATAAAAATRSATARTSERCSARSCGSTRPDGEAVPVPAATRSSRPGRGPRSTPTGCATRGASRSTAETGRPLDRRRRPGHARGDRRWSRGDQLGPRQLRLVRVRGRPALQRRPAGAGRDPAGASSTGAIGGCSVTGGYVVRDRGADLARTAATCTATSARASCAASPPTPTGPRPTTARSASSVEQLSSFGEDLDGHVYAISLGGPGLPARRRVSRASLVEMTRSPWQGS